MSMVRRPAAGWRSASDQPGSEAGISWPSSATGPCSAETRLAGRVVRTRYRINPQAHRARGAPVTPSSNG